MQVNLKFGNHVLPLSIPAVLKMRCGAVAINPATAGMFLVMRTLSPTHPDYYKFALPELLFDAMDVAARQLPENSRIGMAGPVLMMSSISPLSPLLEIDQEFDGFHANGVSIDWRTAQRWMNSTLTTIPKIGLDCGTPWQMTRNLLVMCLISCLARHANGRESIAWFEEACALTRDLMRVERPDPNHHFDVLSPEGAMAAGLCWLDPFATHPVICDMETAYEPVSAFTAPMTSYAKQIASLGLDEIRAARDALAAIIGDDRDAAETMSAHQVLASTGRALSLSADMSTLLGVIDTPGGRG